MSFQFGFGHYLPEDETGSVTPFPSRDSILTVKDRPFHKTTAFVWLVIPIRQDQSWCEDKFIAKLEFPQGGERTCSAPHSHSNLVRGQVSSPP